MKTVSKLMLMLPIVLFLCWYIPVAYMNVYSCDDYWFGSNVHTYGFWGTQSYYWNYWEGSFTHTFMASLPRAFSFDKMPFVGNMFALCLISFSFYYFIKTYFSLTCRKSLLCALYIVSAMFVFTTGGAEIRYWICASLTYLTELSAVLLLLSVYHKSSSVPIRKWIVPMSILLFLVGGSKLNFILLALFGMIAHDVYFKRKLQREVIVIYLLFAVMVALNIAAPGNYIRLEEETAPSEMEDMSIVDVVIFRLKTILPFFIYSVLLLPLSKYIGTSVKLDKSRFKHVFALFALYFVADSVIMYVCFHDAGPKRVYITSEVTIYLLMLCILASVQGKFKNIVCRFASAIAIVVFVCANIPLLNQVLPSIEYSTKATERDKFVANSGDVAILKLEELPESYLLLSYFSNEADWIKYVYLPYFDKQCEVVLIPESKGKQ